MSEDIWKIIESVAISLSFIVATLAYLADRNRVKNSENKERLLSWQTGIVHEIFQKSSSQQISFDAIMQKYRSEAQAAQTDVDKHALSAEALRTILFRFVNDSIISQHGNDLYSLKTIGEAKDLMKSALGVTKPGFNLGDLYQETSSIMQAVGPLMATSLTSAVNEQRILGVVAGILIEEPDRYTSSDLVVKLANQLSISNDQVQIAVNTLIAKTKIHVRQDGKLSLAKSIINMDGDC
jgi:hypothetical protein